MAQFLRVGLPSRVIVRADAQRAPTMVTDEHASFSRVSQGSSYGDGHVDSSAAPRKAHHNAVRGRLQAGLAGCGHTTQFEVRLALVNVHDQRSDAASHGRSALFGMALVLQRGSQRIEEG